MHCPSVGTRLFFLLGNPLGHTLSPPMHNRAFNKLGMDALYLPVEVAPENLETVFKGLICMNSGGFNVTIPHKIPIIDLLDELDPLAEVIGAVNTICLQNGRTRGYNTDGDGFMISLEKQLNSTLDDRRFIILGSGGAARGIAMTLAFRGVPRIFLCNRTLSRAEALAGEINTKIRSCAQAVLQTPGELAKILPGCDILVNATSVGMHPHHQVSPIDEALLFKELVVADLVYKPLMTRLLQAAQDRGCTIVNGRGMLIHQGALAFKLWTGMEPAVEEMAAALRS